MIAKKIAKKKVGFAVVGLGNIAQGSVLHAFANCKKAKLVAPVSRDAGKAARVPRHFNASTHRPLEAGGVQGHRDVVFVDASYGSATSKRSIAIEY